MKTETSALSEAALLLRPQWQTPPRVRCGYTTRCGGVSPAPYDDGAGGGGLNLAQHVGDAVPLVEQNRALLQRRLPSAPLWLNQVHGTRVLDASRFAAGLSSACEDADASFAAAAATVCCVMTADCLPVLLCDSRGVVVGAAHAGWRGLAGGVLQNTVQAMAAVPGAGQLQAWLGAAIGPTQFEVGEEVRAAFRTALGAESEAAFVPLAGRKYLADIYALARLALRQAGVTQISGGLECTVSRPDRYYSYRRDKVTGRMATLIWLED